MKKLCSPQKKDQLAQTVFLFVLLDSKLSNSKNIILEYEMGDICKESAPKAHISTRIEITCEHGTFRSQPEFTFRKGCTHNFFWRHNAACPTNELGQEATAEEHSRLLLRTTDPNTDAHSVLKPWDGCRLYSSKGPRPRHNHASHFVSLLLPPCSKATPGIG